MMSDGVRYLNREMADAMCNQASLDSMREQHYKDSVEIDRLNAEVKRLCAGNQSWHLEADARGREVDRLVALMTDGHIITTEQIDKAWRVAYDASGRLSIPCAALKELGIGACEDCGGSGESSPTQPYTTYGDPTDPTPTTCSTCHGHGWRKENIGIVECEDCYGSGRIPAPWNEESGETVKCPTCHGHGWVKTSVDADKY